MTTKPRFRCWSCGETFTSYAAAERHIDANRRDLSSEHGGRIEVIQ
jgi:transposase-like protein